MRTERFGTVWAEGVELHNLAFGKALFLSAQLDIYNVSWNGKRHEHCHAVDACQGLAFSGNIGNEDFFE